MGIDSERGKVMWKMSFLAVFCSLWKERNQRCYEGKILDVASIKEKINFSVASWISLSPLFKGIPTDYIMHNWAEVAVAQSLD